MGRVKLWYIPLEIGAWEQDVNMISLEAEGALLKIIFKLWKSEDKGRQKFALPAMALMLKKSPDEVIKILQELKENSVLNIDFGEDNAVTIESRRIAREAEISRQNSQNGKAGGRPKKRKETKLKPKKENSDRNSDYDYNYDYESGSDSDSELKDKNGALSNFENEAVEILGYLNELADRDFRTNNQQHLKFIRARLKDGYTVEELKAIVVLKVHEWQDDQKMTKYLRPATLFNAEKCAQYRDEVTTTRRTGMAPSKNGNSGAKNAGLTARVQNLLKTYEP